MNFRRSLLILLLACPGALFAGTLEFAKPVEEIDVPIGSPTVTARFEFINKTAKPVTILRHESDCSCLTLKTEGKKMRYEPGESGVLTGTIQTGISTGKVEKSIRLWFDGEPADKPSAQLMVRLKITELVTIEPKTLKWELNSATEPQTATIRFPEKAPAKIKSITCSNPNFTPELKTIEEGRAYEVKVACASTASKALGVMTVSIDSPLPAQQTVLFYGVVK